MSKANKGSFQVRIDLDELHDSLDIMRKDFDKELHDALDQVGLFTVSQIIASPRTPWVRGDMARSSRHDIELDKKRVAIISGDRGAIRYALWVHQGTRMKEERPFIKWAIKDIKPAIRGRFRRMVANLLRRGMM